MSTQYGNVPIVLVPGFMGPAWNEEHNANPCEGLYSYWGEATSMGSEESPVYCTWPSGMASLHDRACELFAQIKGGTVDYGEEHSQHCGHARFGRTYSGLYPAWSEDNPIHLVGHSLGGNTARMLQHLVRSQAFPGHETSAKWVVSITALNTPLNGSLTAYALGAKHPQHEEAHASQVVKGSVGHLIGCAVHLCGFFKVQPFGYDLGLDHWGLSFRRTSHQRGRGRVGALVGALVGHSELVEEQDNAAFDLTVHAMAKCNAAIGPGFPDTFYLSFVGTASRANRLPELPARASLVDALRWLGQAAGIAMRRAALATLRVVTACHEWRGRVGSLVGAEQGEWGRDSDGLCCRFSQTCPQVGLQARTATQPLPASPSGMARGVWHVTEHAEDHLGIVPHPADPARQHAFFHALFATLRALRAPAPTPALTPSSLRARWLRGVVRGLGWSAGSLRSSFRRRSSAASSASSPAAGPLLRSDSRLSAGATHTPRHATGPAQALPAVPVNATVRRTSYDTEMEVVGSEPYSWVESRTCGA